MKLAIVDDDAQHANFVSEILRSVDHDVETFTKIADFQRRVRRDTFDLVMLDWNMPEMSGLELLDWVKTIGAPELPIIMVTARTESQDIAKALDRGADDYITKPIERAILLSRINAVGRRTVGRVRTEQAISLHGISINTATFQANIGTETVELTAKECELAVMLLNNLGRPLSRGYLLEHIWAKSADLATRTLDAHISRVRTKLHLRPENGFNLSTIYGFGYRLEYINAA